MKNSFYSKKNTFLILIAVNILSGCAQEEMSSENTIKAKKWEKVTLSFQGPETSEESEVNPFLDYRLDVTFTNGDHKLIVPGFYAADGNSAETSATAGNVWQVRFRPDKTGKWTYNVSFKKGADIAVSDDLSFAASTWFDGQIGAIEVTDADANQKGRLKVVNHRYLKYADADTYFLKNGAGSPENLLAYEDFDGTYRGVEAVERSGESTAKNSLHSYSPHVKDWKEGDPVWQGGKGKGLIGGINYLKSEGLNSMYFLTLNITGDGEDVWPYTAYEERKRFDCSKLDQWEIVFDHMENSDMLLHFITQETENELLLDNGNTGLERKLYYRELVARFGHHKMLTWNMGEENGFAPFTPKAQNTAQRKAMLDYFEQIDPYENLAVVHSHANRVYRDSVFYPLLGYENLDGMSAQIHKPHEVYEATKKWLALASETSKNWIISIDEIGPAERGVDPDDREGDNNQDDIRKQNIWGHFMAGGAGLEWYFGYKNHNNDLACEDWRSRDQFWDYGRIALDFFNNYLPFHEMEVQEDLLIGDGFCFAKEGEVYVVYLINGGKSSLNITSTGNYKLSWFNPRTGGELIRGTELKVEAAGKKDLGLPPSDQNEDWVALITKAAI